MTYKIKKLGYERTPTSGQMRVEMPDGSQWDVPLQVIADSRDEYYRDEAEDTIGFIRAGQLETYDLKDWAANNMNWDEVREYAIPLPASENQKPNYQEGWVNGKKEIIGL